MTVNERRLGDRILHALQLALEQRHLEVAEPLALALEAALTRFGGKDMVDHREFTEAMDLAFVKLDELRRTAHSL